MEETAYKIPAKTKFQEVFGESPEIKALEYFMSFVDIDVTITDIVRGAKIGRARAYEIIDNLKRKDIIIETRRIGASKFYKLNINSKIVQNLIGLFKNVLRESAMKEFAY